MDHNGGNGLENDLSELQINSQSIGTSIEEPTQPPNQDAFRDITAEFSEASEQLEVGQLVKDPYFTLLQAVGALEIMDPKMDSGLMEPEYESFDALKPRLPEEIMGIMDRLLCNEMSWHTGSALSQTIFTNLYIDKLLSSEPGVLEEATFGVLPDHPREPGQELVVNLLRPYCLGLLRCCGYVNDQIVADHDRYNVHDEEDFVTTRYGPSLQLEEVTQDEAVDLVESALTWLKSSQDLSDELREALKQRLIMRKALLRGLPCLIHETAWDECFDALKEVEKTHSLGKPVSEAWSTSVQRKLASQAPPRPIVEKDFSEAVKNVEQLCNERKHISQLADYGGDATNLVAFLQHTMARRPTPLPLTRSVIQNMIFPDGDLVGLKRVLLDDVKELINPVDLLLDPTNDDVEAPHNPRFQIVKRKKWFVVRAGRSYFELYRNLCQNRARLRRLLCHAIADWDTLQVEAEEVDTELRVFTEEVPMNNGTEDVWSYPLSSWVYHYKLRQMEWVHLLGFELEIYQPYEFSGMYWYIGLYVHTRMGHLQRILEFANANGSRKKKGKKKGKSEDDMLKTRSLLNLHLLEATALNEITDGMQQLYLALAKLNLLKKPEQGYGSDALRYELRMKPFLTIGLPEVYPFDQWQNLTNPDIEVWGLLEGASDSIAEARQHYDRLSKLDAGVARVTLCEEDFRMNIREIQRSCIGAGVAIAMLKKAVDAGTTEQLEVVVERDKYHPFFPVPKVVVKS